MQNIIKKSAAFFAVVFMLGFVGHANAQESQGTGTSTTRLTIEAACEFTTDTIQFIHTVSNTTTTDVTDSGNLVFECSKGASYTVKANRTPGAGSSIQLVNTGGTEEVAYTATINSVAITSSTPVEVMTGTGAGLGTSVNVPSAISVSAAAINAATPDIYGGVVTVELFL